MVCNPLLEYLGALSAQIVLLQTPELVKEVEEEAQVYPAVLSVRIISSADLFLFLWLFQTESLNPWIVVFL